ncbi:Phenylacetate-coenzyme A ligase PaaK, adenylate-forming domain family [Megasphaera paucivorans]|uniref:Phenylacetate-coenzyme A ligase PaaK, adenylate-forming domain family n=2 Tax=Megasphaera paucivorans TaxID=349095 RepID=A0A1G9XUH9_9FIRM|nr:Phenylacetate-coenzyme A ligase PaaK, adenylate-forming domain family [Megasphaera paucivorans]
MKITCLENYMKRITQLDRLSRTSIGTFQLTALNTVLKREHARDGFYRMLPSHITSLEELQYFPFTTSRQLMDNSTSLLLCSQAEIQRIITDQTSGTTGVPKRVFYTAGDCKNTLDFFVAGLAEMVFPGSRTMICMPFSGPYSLGSLISQAIERLGAVPIKAGTECTFGEYSTILQQQKPDTFIGMAAPLLSILRFCGSYALKRALLSGDACPETVKSAIEHFGIVLFPHYGSREMALGGAVTCAAHEGMHVRENHVIVEIIGEKGEQLPPGEYGELVITTIGMEAMPLIRYRTGDITRIFPNQCPCGSEIIRLDHVRRSNHYMELLDNILFSYEWLVDYCITISAQIVDIRIITLSKSKLENTINSKITEIFPGKEIHLSATPCDISDTLFYRGKRGIQIC